MLQAQTILNRQGLAVVSEPGINDTTPFCPHNPNCLQAFFSHPFVAIQSGVSEAKKLIQHERAIEETLSRLPSRKELTSLLSSDWASKRHLESIKLDPISVLSANGNIYKIQLPTFVTHQTNSLLSDFYYVESTSSNGLQSFSNSERRCHSTKAQVSFKSNFSDEPLSVEVEELSISATGCDSKTHFKVEIFDTENQLQPIIKRDACLAKDSLRFTQADFRKAIELNPRTASPNLFVRISETSINGANFRFSMS